MKQKDIIKAYKVLEQLYRTKLPLSVSWKFYQLMNSLRPRYQFQYEKEMEVFQKYGASIFPDGTIQLQDPEDKGAQEAFVSEYNSTCSELGDLDVDIGEVKKIVIHTDDQLSVSMEDLDALSAFVQVSED